MTSLLDELDAADDFTGKIRRTANGRPYVLANPDWLMYPEEHEAERRGFTDKPGEPRGPSKIYTRTTTYISCLEDTYSLGQHQERGVVYGMALRKSLCKRALNVDLADEPRAKEELNAIAALARDAAGWNEKADLGTTFHDTAEILDSNPTGARYLRTYSRLDGETRAMLDAYQVETANWEYAHIEQGIVNDDLCYYGTPDRLRWLDEGSSIMASNWDVRKGKPRKLRVSDIKTGRIDYGQQKMALQLAAYAIGQLYDPDTGIRTELDIDTEYGEIVHVPYGEGRCTVYTVPIADAVTALQELVPRVRAFRARKNWFADPVGGALFSGRAAAWSGEVGAL